MQLTPREFALLSTLAGQPGRVFTRAQLLERVWGAEYYDEHVVDVHMANLRHKLGDDRTQGPHAGDRTRSRLPVRSAGSSVRRDG